MLRHRKTSNRVIATPRQLDKLIEEATVDSYNEEEQASGFFAMIEENLTLPFTQSIEPPCDRRRSASSCRWSAGWISMI